MYEKIAVFLTILLLIGIALTPIDTSDRITLTMDEPADIHPTEKVINKTIKRLPLEIELINI